MYIDDWWGKLPWVRVRGWSVKSERGVSMKMFTDCSGECCVCVCSGGCIAGHGDDYFYPATKEQIIERLNQNQYPSQRQYMIDYLQNKMNHIYKEDVK